MKKLIAIAALALIAITPAVAAAQAPAGFSGKWEGTFTREGGNAGPVVFNLVQKGNVITGTAGPADQQFPVLKGGTVTAGTAKFDVQQTNGPLFKFVLTIVKGRLAGDMIATRPDGSVGGKGKVDAAKAKPAALKK
jgi:opacity protein-like surface antigen